jgi:uncharacterized membrane protein
LQLVVGVLLVLFGMRWLRKAILRSAGVIALHDEEAIFIKEVNALCPDGISVPSHLDIVAIATTFKAVVLEGLEVVFIVIATGAVSHMLIPASLGAAAAGTLVIVLGLLIHKPLSRVPENLLKFAVGILRVLMYLMDRVEGRPIQKQEDKMTFDPDRPLKGTIEHIGQSRNFEASGQGNSKQFKKAEYR